MLAAQVDAALAVLSVALVVVQVGEPDQNSDYWVEKQEVVILVLLKEVFAMALVAAVVVPQNLYCRLY